MIVCPKCGGAFASPRDIEVHATILPAGIWDGKSQCDSLREVRLEEES